ncbi:MAG: recombinase family protein [Candidatus Omnitrophota bacterium]|jgi:site-specific DNA recombinase
MKSEQPKIAACYARVSTDMQREKGHSIEYQRDSLIKYSKEHGLNPVLYVDAGISAKDTRRPELQKMLEDIKNGRVSVVLVTKLDRITRSLKDLVNLKETFDVHGVSFKSLTESFDSSTAMGRFTSSLFGSIAEMEREIIGERVREAMKHRAGKGRYNGGVVAFGFSSYAQQVRINKNKGMSKDEAEQAAKERCPAEKQLCVNPEEAKILNQIFDKYIETESLRAVTHWLNTKRYKSRYGTSWAATSVRRVLQSQTYIGKVVWGKRLSSKSTTGITYRPKDKWIVANAEYPGIVPKEKFETVQSILERRRFEPRRKLSKNILSGLVWCGKCGGRIYGITYRNRKRNESFAYYRCNTHLAKGSSVCPGTTIPKTLFEKAITDKILRLGEGKPLMDLKRAMVLYERHYQKRERKPSEKVETTRRVDAIKQKLKVLMERLEDGTVSPSDYSARVKELKDELQLHEKAMGEMPEAMDEPQAPPVSFEAVSEALRDIKKVWKGLDYQGRKDLLAKMIHRITIHDKCSPIDMELYFFNLINRTNTDSSRQPKENQPGM